uniref:phosphoribosyl-ATP diphosphatase n=1 Tax=Aegilops tauschii subsp. strangulata TaxID=200361 RepID=A0A453EQW7_AEGTS
MDLHAIQGQRPATILQSMMHYKVQRYLSLMNLPVNMNLLELKYYCISQSNQERQVATTLYSLEDTISRRKEEIVTEGSGKPSWTKKLLLDNQLLCSKIREEAGELIETLLENEDKSRTASEMADLLYHAMVLLSVRDVKMEEVLEVLRRRFSQSGVEEKASRKKS